MEETSSAFTVSTSSFLHQVKKGDIIKHTLKGFIEIISSDN